MELLGLHHVAVICSNYSQSKHFYTKILKLPIIAEHYRAARQSYKLDLALPNGSQIELFSFPEPPKRPTQPEACGLRHLALAVNDIVAAVTYLNSYQVETEAIRVDEFTHKRFTFFRDPDGLPIELYEQ
ncbi:MULTISPECIES: SMU1112c/YaeR family gloxylase I-like metalloprotein [unclassified Pseudoalteromonas]|uniref:SMU1112c/YaeR family gloxylase I-like metalloprotein n=1 Tax=unclassified Pseudoalteromonas TaxID=194690 RepID=UPI003014F952